MSDSGTSVKETQLKAREERRKRREEEQAARILALQLERINELNIAHSLEPH